MISRPFAPASFGVLTSASSFTVDDPGAVGTNDIVIVGVSIREDRTCATPAGGWNLIGTDTIVSGSGASGNRHYTFWCRGEPGTWVFELSSSTAGWAWARDVYSGWSLTGDPYSYTATKAENASITIEVPAIPDTRPGSWAVAIAGMTDTVSPPTSFGTGAGYANQTEAFTGAGTYAVMLASQQLFSTTVADGCDACPPPRRTRLRVCWR